MLNKIVIECPRFDGMSYTYWKTKMEGYLEYYRYDVENSCMTPYVSPVNGLSIVD
jgi:hypothetical protein